MEIQNSNASARLLLLLCAPRTARAQFIQKQQLDEREHARRSRIVRSAAIAFPLVCYSAALVLVYISCNRALPRRAHRFLWKLPYQQTNTKSSATICIWANEQGQQSKAEPLRK